MLWVRERFAWIQRTAIEQFVEQWTFWKCEVCVPKSWQCSLDWFEWDDARSIKSSNVIMNFMVIVSSPARTRFAAWHISDAVSRVFLIKTFLSVLSRRSNSCRSCGKYKVKQNDLKFQKRINLVRQCVSFTEREKLFRRCTKTRRERECDKKEINVNLTPYVC